MANKKITELTHLETPIDADLFPIVDIASNETKKVSLANLIVTTGNTHSVESRRSANQILTTANAVELAAGIASGGGSSSLSNVLHTTTIANSYATGGTTSNLDKVLVYLNGIYQNENQYVLSNSTHNIQFKIATFSAGLELEIRKF